jgi:type IV pilus assembly protein PilB
MGIEPFLVGNSINLVAAQRLVRKVCENCKEPHEIPANRLIEAGMSEDQLPQVHAMKGRGCDRCGGTGYKGRVGLFEIMEVSEPVRDLILRNPPVFELRDCAVKEGMSTLRQSGLAKVREGVTTLEEVVRETM